MKTLLLILLLYIVQPVSNEQIYKNTGFYNTPVQYEPIISTNSYGRMRKVVGYTGDGNDSIDTGSSTRGNPQDMWNSDYSYYYKNGYWYRNNGTSWEYWNSLLGLGWLLWDWYPTSEPKNPTQYFPENPTPVGSPICLLPLGLLYFLKKKNNVLFNKTDPPLI